MEQPIPMRNMPAHYHARRIEIDGMSHGPGLIEVFGVSATVNHGGSPAHALRPNIDMWSFGLGRRVHIIPHRPWIRIDVRMTCLSTYGPPRTIETPAIVTCDAIQDLLSDAEELVLKLTNAGCSRIHPGEDCDIDSLDVMPFAYSDGSRTNTVVMRYTRKEATK